VETAADPLGFSLQGELSTQNRRYESPRMICRKCAYDPRQPHYNAREENILVVSRIILQEIFSFDGLNRGKIREVLLF